MREVIKRALADALRSLSARLPLQSSFLEVFPSRHSEHGDYTSNIAMVLARKAKMAPRELAENILSEASFPDEIEKVEIVKPGFINFHLKVEVARSLLVRILKEGEEFQKTKLAKRRRALIEFVSANPTGPLHVGHGRGAAYGSALADLFAWSGYEVESEYFVNDAGRQTDILALSVWLRYLKLVGYRGEISLPGLVYRGEYIGDLSTALKNKYGSELCPKRDDLVWNNVAGADEEKFLDELIRLQRGEIGEDATRDIAKFSLNAIKNNIKGDLDDFRSRFHSWRSERQLIEEGKVAAVLESLEAQGHIYHENGASWFRSTSFGDEKDRVVARANGSFTYFASDIAYHKNKFERGYDLLINVWGADHHGYVPRLRAAVAAMGYQPDKLRIVLVQFVSLLRARVKVAMSTRAGEYVTLRELFQEVGVDATRYFFLSRKPSQHLLFDVDLAKSRSDENPVFYIQYAYARISSIVAKFNLRHKEFNKDAVGLHLLKEEKELDLMRYLARYSDILRIAVESMEPHHVLSYIREVAAKFHACYSGSRVLVDDALLRDARLKLFVAAGIVIRNGLRVLRIDAPRRM